MKKIPIVNYIKVFILSVVTIFLVLVLANFYNNKRQYERANDDVMGILSNIKFEELNEYLTENSDGFIYISSSIDTSLDSFESKFKEYIVNEELDKYFVYIDSSVFSATTYSELKSLYFASNVKDVSLGRANLLSVHNGKITSILLVDVNNFEEVNTFIRMHEVTE